MRAGLVRGAAAGADGGPAGPRRRKICTEYQQVVPNARWREKASQATGAHVAPRLLQGIQAVAADLELFPLGALYGGPTVLVTGVELRRESRRAASLYGLMAVRKIG